MKRINRKVSTNEFHAVAVTRRELDQLRLYALTERAVEVLKLDDRHGRGRRAPERSIHFQVEPKSGRRFHIDDYDGLRP